MSLITRHPLQIFGDLQRDMNRLFENRMAPTSSNLISSGDWLPPVDIHEDKDSYLLAIDLPGVNPDDIHVSTHNDVLSISGKRETVHEEKDQKRSERFFGSFVREFSMPENADLDNVQASSKHGVLELRVPKTVKPEPRRVAITVN
jgi:HSP20 family protein